MWRRPFGLFVLTVMVTHAAPVGSETPYRFVAKEDGFVHVSLHRGYHQLPANIEVFESTPGGGLQEWSAEVRSYTPENTQNHPGRLSFRTGRVRAGTTYEIRVTEPGELDVRFFPVEPQPSPKRAVDAGMSWIIRAADAWLANQPRQGAVAREGQIQHPESRACVACHITQFPVRAYLTAVHNGFAAREALPLGAVVERLRENPRPLYGHPGVNWARVIYSARTVSSRLPVLLSMYNAATQTSPAADRDRVLGAARFLLLSGECETGKLRPEADGSRPDVSGFEIGLQTWEAFRLAASAEPGNPGWLKQSACMERILQTSKPQNVIDAAWRIVALKRTGQKTDAAVRELLQFQQADGRFGMEFSKDAPPSDFISYHVLYAFAVAGHRGPEVDRLAAYTLRSQRADGSWRGVPEYKGFDTPFRDTQFAVMALSELYARKAPAPAVSEPVLSRKDTDPWRSGSRDAVQQELLARMANEKEPAQPLIDAVAATLDENLGQLREWQRLIRLPADQARVEEALRADSQRAATLLARALSAGSRTLRLRVLKSMSTVTGVEGFPKRPRVGNDMEAPQILADQDAQLEKAIVACLETEDPELTREAIRAATALTDVITPAFTKAMVRLAPKLGDVILEAWGPDARGSLTLSRGGPVDEELRQLVTKALNDRNPQQLSLVLPLLASLEHGDSFTREPYLSGAMGRLLNDRLEEPVLQAASVFPDILNGPLMRTEMLTALKSTDPLLVRAAVVLVLERYLVNPSVVELSIQYLAASRGLARRMLLDSLDPDRIRFRIDQISAYSPPRVAMPADSNILGFPLVQSFVQTSLRDSDPQVQAAALDLTRKHARLRNVPEIRAALADLSNSPSGRNRLLGRAAIEGTSVSVPAQQMLDFRFFRDRVHPLFTTPGPDGRSCVMCHRSNARFPLRAEANADFQAVLKKIDLQDPAQSPVLVKPLLPGITADGDVFRTSHNGGVRWPDRNGSSAYQTILEWIRGRRADADE